MWGKRGLGGLVALAAVCGGAGQDTDAADLFDDLPRVTAMAPVNASLEEHHTDHFEIEGGFAVRRGQAFSLLVNTSVELNLTRDEVRLANNREAAYNNPDFQVVSTERVAPGQYRVNVTTDVTAPVGKYEDLIVSVQHKTPVDASNATDAVTYTYPFPVYFLFNPWLKEDAMVYIPSAEMREEHVIRSYGDVFCGSTGSYETTKWYYGHTDQVTLDALFHLLEKVDRAKAGDPITVVQTVAQNQGMMRKKDGSVLVGSEDSLLEGNWGDFPFEEHNDPEIWTSTTDILNKWKETGKPTKYGQCWVFGALQNALMRALGVGSRQLTAFGAWMDMSSRRDKHHKLHHVADEYYDLKGAAVYIESQAWNYHSWNDIWLQRDNATLSGWQSLDGTPPGKIGPAPVKEIRALGESYPFNASDVISTVHSTQRSFLVSCDAEHKPKDHLKGCTVNKLLKYDHSGLPLLLSSRTFANGTLGELNITDEFIDPTMDAFIPFTSDDKPASRRLLRAGDSSEPCEHKEWQNATAEVDVKLVPFAYGIMIGNPIAGEVQLLTKGLVQGEEVEVNMMVTLESRMGTFIKGIYSSSTHVLVEGRVIVLPYSIDSSAYLRKDLRDVFVKIVVTGVSASGAHFFAKDVMDIDAPQVQQVVPATLELPAAADAVVPASAHFRNPLTFVLDNVCLKLHSHQLNFKGLPSNATSVQVCQQLQPGQVLTVSAELLPPNKPGLYYVITSLTGDFVPNTQAHSELLVTERAASAADEATAVETLVVSPELELTMQ